MGWPKGKPRGPRIRQTPLQREPIRSVWSGKMREGDWEGFEMEEGNESPDRLHIPKDMIPEGMDLRWVTYEVRGQPFPQWEANARKTGWRGVHQADFDGRFNGKFMSPGKEGAITVDGLILMARPMEISKRAKAADKRRAAEQVFIKERDIRGGNMPISGADHPTALASNKVNKTFERLEIPTSDE